MDAVDDLSDAIDVTRELLLPVRVGLWLKLAIVVLFVGGGLGLGGGAPTGDIELFVDEPTIEAGIEELPEDVLALIAAAVVLGILLWIGFALVGAIMEFVFIESLRSNAVRIGQYGRANLGKGVRLFVFRLVASLVLFALVGVPLLLALDGASSETVLESLALVGLLAIPLYLVYAVVMRFTSEFVAPVMLLEDRGVLGSWRRFWPTFTSNRSQYVVYLLLVWILQLVINIAVGLVVVFGGLIVAIPFVILGGLAFVAGGIGVYLAIAIGIVGVLAIVLLFAIVQMPIRTYFQYYALLLLGDTNAELDLIPEQRAAARDGGGNGGAGDTIQSDRWDRTDRSSERTGTDTDTDADDDRNDGWSLDESGFRDDDGDVSDWDASNDDRDDRDDRDDHDDNDDRDDRGW